MTRLLPLFLMALAVGASEASFSTIWSMDTAERDTIKVQRKSAGGVWLYTEGVASNLTSEEASSLGRALLEAAGEKPEQPSCDFLKGYIEMRNRMISDPETSDFLRGIYNKEVAWARVKIQSIALDTGCGKVAQ